VKANATWVKVWLRRDPVPHSRHSGERSRLSNRFQDSSFESTRGQGAKLQDVSRRIVLAGGEAEDDVSIHGGVNWANRPGQASMGNYRHAAGLFFREHGVGRNDADRAVVTSER
jgi:hypothetical protein